MAKERALLGPFVGVLAGAGYGLCARWVFDGRPAPWVETTFVALSVAFLFLVPLGLGAITVYFGSPRIRSSWLSWILLPWVSCSLLTVGLVALAWEGRICIVIAAPVFLGMGSLGGIMAGLVLRWRQRRAAPPVVTALAILPLALFPAERQLAPPVEERTVRTSILINASADEVWRQIVRVPEIQAHELPASLSRRMGIPEPREAKLDRDGAGGVREASFRGGLRFHETISEWEPEQTLGFTIRVVPESVSEAVLDPHVRVGSPHFDVLYGQFRIEPWGRGRVRLHLQSRHRLSTLFNGYAGMWSDAVMRDIQNGISLVVKRRCEAAVGG